MMGLRQCVLGLLLLVAFAHVSNGSPMARAFRPRLLTQVPQNAVPQLGGQWSPFLGVQSPSLQIAPQALNLADSSIQSKQELQGPAIPLAWNYPTLSAEPVQPAINFVLQQPKPFNSVAVQCLENGAHVEVKQDFFGTGHLVDPSLLSLGGCGMVNVDTAAKVVVFQTMLQDCNSHQVVTEEELVYVFTLDYKPAALPNTPIVRSSSATVGIECHYPRKHNVSSNALQPAWVPYAATVVAEDILVFSLKLMTDDWKFERPTNVYFLGDTVNIQASVKQYNHVPLRIFVDHCVATATPDVTVAPSYQFIENHGCFTDAKYTASSSLFLPRVHDDTLQFQLETFRFQQEISGFVYITCLLKASPASTSQIDETHKACSFKSQGWVSSDGSDQVCGCCDASCGPSMDTTFPRPPGGVQWEGKAQVGPLQVWDSKPTKSV